MYFRIWHYLCRVGAPVLFPAALLAIVMQRGSVLQGIGVGAILVMFILGLVGAVMGVFLSLGKLRMRCPFCGEKGMVSGDEGGLTLDCPECGLVYETGFLKLRLARAANEKPKADEGTDTP